MDPYYNEMQVPKVLSHLNSNKCLFILFLKALSNLECTYSFQSAEIKRHLVKFSNEYTNIKLFVRFWAYFCKMIHYLWKSSIDLYTHENLKQHNFICMDQQRLQAENLILLQKVQQLIYHTANYSTGNFPTANFPIAKFSTFFCQQLICQQLFVRGTQ